MVGLAAEGGGGALRRVVLRVVGMQVHDGRPLPVLGWEACCAQD